jgi:Mn-dependent DtxR family transcriptional regulator
MDEVHDIAEQLEHIKSEKLINKLDDFLETLPKIHMVTDSKRWRNI